MGLSCKPNIYASWSTSELRVRLAHCETGFSPPVKYFYWPFQDGASFVDHICYFCLVFVMFLRVCLLMPCGHLLGKRWPLGFNLWCLIVKLSLTHLYPGVGMVLDCIDSRSLPFFLLLNITWSTLMSASTYKICTETALFQSLFCFCDSISRWVAANVSIVRDSVEAYVCRLVSEISSLCLWRLVRVCAGLRPFFAVVSPNQQFKSCWTNSSLQPLPSSW